MHFAVLALWKGSYFWAEVWFGGQNPTGSKMGPPKH